MTCEVSVEEEELSVDEVDGLVIISSGFVVGFGSSLLIQSGLVVIMT